MPCRPGPSRRVPLYTVRCGNQLEIDGDVLPRHRLAIGAFAAGDRAAPPGVVQHMALGAWRLHACRRVAWQSHSSLVRDNVNRALAV